MPNHQLNHRTKSIYEKTLSASVKRRALTMTHEVEHAGYGAMLSRLMTGLNQSLIYSANYHFSIASKYHIDDLFDIEVKQNEGSFLKNKKKVWNFYRDTWDVKYSILTIKWFIKKSGYKEQVRAEHQYPECPILIGESISGINGAQFWRSSSAENQNPISKIFWM